MGKIRIYLLCCIFSFFMQSLCQSEVITLKSGERIEGKIVEQTDKYVKLDFEGARIIYLKDEILNISPAASNDPAQARALYKAYPGQLNVSVNKPKESKPKYGGKRYQNVPEPITQAVANNQPAIPVQIEGLASSGNYQEMVKAAILGLDGLKLQEEKN